MFQFIQIPNQFIEKKRDKLQLEENWESMSQAAQE